MTYTRTQYHVPGCSQEGNKPCRRRSRLRCRWCRRCTPRLHWSTGKTARSSHPHVCSRDYMLAGQQHEDTTINPELPGCSYYWNNRVGTNSAACCILRDFDLCRLRCALWTLVCTSAALSFLTHSSNFLYMPRPPTGARTNSTIAQHSSPAALFLPIYTRMQPTLHLHRASIPVPISLPLPHPAGGGGWVINIVKQENLSFAPTRSDRYKTMQGSSTSEAMSLSGTKLD